VQAAPTGPISASFALVDQWGTPVTQASYPGRYLLVFFGFTHCAQVCPRELGKLSAALDLIGSAAERIQPLYITVDPDRDTPARMLAYTTANAPRFIGLTGDTQAIAQAKKAYRVYASRLEDADARGGYTVPHTAMAYLVDPAGRYAAHFSDAMDQGAVARRLQELVR
jgi:protein SCO1/2